MAARRPKKPLQAAPTGAAADSGLTPADLQRRRFDVTVVASVLAYSSDAGEQPNDAELPALAEQHFGWLRSELEPIADLARVKKKDAVLGAVTVEDAATADVVFNGFFRLWFGLTFPSGGGVTLNPHKPGAPINFEKGRAFLDEQLGRLYVVEHYRLTKDGIVRAAVPYLPTVSSCIAYAIAVLMESRWGMADRVRVCPYRPDPEKGFHTFLNFRLKEDGNLMGGAGMKYCCPAHENADAQRRSRARQARSRR